MGGDQGDGGIDNRWHSAGALERSLSVAGAAVRGGVCSSGAVIGQGRVVPGGLAVGGGWPPLTYHVASAGGHSSRQGEPCREAGRPLTNDWRISRCEA